MITLGKVLICQVFVRCLQSEYANRDYDRQNELREICRQDQLKPSEGILYAIQSSLHKKDYPDGEQASF